MSETLKNAIDVKKSADNSKIEQDVNQVQKGLEEAVLIEVNLDIDNGNVNGLKQNSDKYKSNPEKFEMFVNALKANGHKQAAREVLDYINDQDKNMRDLVSDYISRGDVDGLVNDSKKFTAGNKTRLAEILNTLASSEKTTNSSVINAAKKALSKIEGSTIMAG